MISSFRLQAVRATFSTLPAASSLWMTTAHSSGDYILVALGVDNRAHGVLIRCPSGHSQALLVSNQRLQAGWAAAVYLT